METAFKAIVYPLAVKAHNVLNLVHQNNNNNNEERRKKREKKESVLLSGAGS